MTGSLQIKKGRFYAVLNFKDEQGNRKPKWFPTGLEERGNKRKAQAVLDKLLAQHQGQNVLKDRAQMLFSDYVLEWIELEKSRIEHTTWESYECYARRHIAPYFEALDLRVCDISAQYIKSYYDYKANGGRLDKKAGGMSSASIKNHSKVIKQVLDAAVLEELIPRNVAEHIPIPKSAIEGSAERGVYLNAEEANTVLRAFQGHRLQPLIYTVLYYGLRRSEVLGLKWDAIDLEKNEMKIQHVVVKIRTIEAKDRTKTKSSQATYDLLPEIKELFKKLFVQQDQFKRLCGKEYQDHGYVFCWDNGDPYRPDYITRSFQSQLKKSGLPCMRFHDLRHSCASILYDKGWGLKDIQEWLRHSNIETTGNIYTHISKSRKKILAQGLENTFKLSDT